MKFAILASGRGSNACKLIDKAKDLNLINKGVLLVNKRNAPVIAKGQEKGITVKNISEIDRSLWEQKASIFLKDFGCQWIFLAGFTWVLSKYFLQNFYDESGFFRVVNIHPSLLPEFPGLNSYRKAWDAQRKVSGITIHLVDEGVDTGPILFQEEFKRDVQDSFESFENKGLAVEHRIYPKIFEDILTSKINLKSYL